MKTLSGLCIDILYLFLTLLILVFNLCLVLSVFTAALAELDIKAVLFPTC